MAAIIGGGRRRKGDMWPVGGVWFAHQIHHLLKEEKENYVRAELLLSPRFSEKVGSPLIIGSSNN
jgi:hypothetical protein